MQGHRGDQRLFRDQRLNGGAHPPRSGARDFLSISVFQAQNQRAAHTAIGKCSTPMRPRLRRAKTAIALHNIPERITGQWHTTTVTRRAANKFSLPPALTAQAKITIDRIATAQTARRVDRTKRCL